MISRAPGSDVTMSLPASALESSPYAESSPGEATYTSPSNANPPSTGRAIAIGGTPPTGCAAVAFGSTAMSSRVITESGSEAAISSTPVWN